MSSKLHFIFFIIVAIALIAAFWYFGLWDKTKDIFLNFGNDVDLESGIGDVKESRQTIENIAKNITAIPQKIISRTSEQIKEAFLKSAKEEVGSAIDSAQQKFGLQSIAPLNERSLTVSLVGRKNSPLSFYIDSQEDGVDYTIDWGDGNKSVGALTSPGKKIVDHTWLTSGSYLVTAEVINKNKEVRRFSFPIAIE